MEILDADDVTHELLAAGGAAVEAIRAAFGMRVVRSDGSVDRAALAAVVFDDPAALAQLNGIVHPLVRQAVENWLALPKARLKAVVVPLLFEVGWDIEWDVIVCVVAEEAIQLQRLMCGRGLTEVQARARIAAQMPVAEKAARSHLVVRNEVGVDALEREAERVFRFLREKSE